MISDKTIRSPLALVVLSVLVFGLAGCSDEQKEEARDVTRPVKTIEISDHQSQKTLVYSGAVRARVESSLGFRVAGKIVERSVNIGDRIKPGDVLARLDSKDLELSLRTAEANLKAAEKGVATADLASRRAQQLYEKNAVAQSQLEQALLTYDQAVSTRDAAEAAFDQARNQVDYAKLRSDVRGIVTAIAADAGTVVAAGTTVVTVALDDEKEVQIAVPENEITEFRPGAAVKASFWSDAALILEGKVREVSGSADPQSRTFSVRVSLPEDSRVLLGMTATIEKNTHDTNGSYVIPLSALAEKNGQKIVWVVDTQTSTVNAREIGVGDFTADGINIATGLGVGDVVVVAGTQFMTDNLKVKMQAQHAAQLQSAAPIR
ncbi:efflux RND transporter periplasmic adaptor subunit [Rhizobium skierniewicense]|uniref:efflux RND transporter periplasmic adaptor subunit n=1 Tax=Rhizobium skierniewicense TaxID=984260 RepID=UPI0015737D28|nr:efflux RND transporter periplasmic adaptor subunit [Rhizobium skierniewicense]NTF34306.1 efflux RND transporter periplasmic adaptor subunit [Rhizobium skierniewicense]